MGAGGSTQRGGGSAGRTRGASNSAAAASSSRRARQLPTTSVRRNATFGVQSVGGVLYMRGCAPKDGGSSNNNNTDDKAAHTSTSTRTRARDKAANASDDAQEVVYAWMVQDVARPGQWAMYAHESQTRLDAAYTAGERSCAVVYKQHACIVDLVTMTQSVQQQQQMMQQQQRVCAVRRVRATRQVDERTHEVTLHEVRDGFVDPFADDLVTTGNNNNNNSANVNNGEDVFAEDDAAAAAASVRTTSPNECNGTTAKATAMQGGGSSGSDVSTADRDALPQLLRRVQAHTEALFCLTLAPSSSSSVAVLTAGVGNTMREWDVDTSTVVRNYDARSLKPCGYVLSARYAHDAADRLVAGGDDSLARIFVVRDGDGGASSSSRGGGGPPSLLAPQQRLRAHTHKVYDAGFIAHSAGGKVVTASMDGTVRVWDVGSSNNTSNSNDGDEPRCVRTDVCSQTHLFSLALSRTQPHLAISCGNDALVNVHDLRAPHSVTMRLSGHTRTLWCCALREVDDGGGGGDGGVPQCLSSGMDGTVRMWDLRAPGSALHVMEHHGREVHHVAYTPHARGVLSCGKDGRVVLADAATGEAVWRATSHSRSAFRVTVHAASQTLLTCSVDGSVHVWRWQACSAW